MNHTIRLSVLTVFWLGVLQAQTPDTTFVDGQNRVYLFRQFDMTILSVHNGFEYLFTPKAVPSLLSVARAGQYRFMINGSFFDGTRLDAQHSGWLHILGKSFGSVWDNRQLTHIVRFDKNSGTLEIIASKAFTPSHNDHTIEFQTGPLVIENSKVVLSLISHSINGSGKYTRTLIAVSNRNEIMFITVRKPVSLDVLGRFLLTLSVFDKKRLDVVNLDGGPSVAFYARAFPKLNYNVDDHLPLLLGVQ
jgi:exopolysaccharide biosynthesis protein